LREWGGGLQLLANAPNKHGTPVQVQFKAIVAALPDECFVQIFVAATGRFAQPHEYRFLKCFWGLAQKARSKGCKLF
jgi:hypothetical protein